MQRDAVYGVFEIGMNHPGEIRELTSLVRPHVAVITNIEPAHIGNFASITDIADATAEIFEGMDDTGTALLNRYIAPLPHRSAERLVGKKGVSSGDYRWSQDHNKKK